MATAVSCSSLLRAARPTVLKSTAPRKRLPGHLLWNSTSVKVLHEKAIILSYLLPGSGLIYAGAPIRGLTSTTLQAGAMLMIIHGLTEGYFFTGSLTGAALFYVFYNGGAQYAATLSTKRNEARIANFRADLIQTLKEVAPK